MKKLFAAIGVALLLTSASSAAGARDLYVRSAYVADIPIGAHLVEGQVTIISDTVLYVEHFTYDGGAPAVYFYLGAENTDSAFQNGLQLMPLLDRAYADETLVLELPPGENLEGYQAISVWCVQFSANFSSDEFTEPVNVPVTGPLGLLLLMVALPIAMRLRR